MKRYSFSTFLYFLLFIILCSLTTEAQKKQAVGFILSSEVYPTPQFKLVPGINYEFRFTKGSGAEVGVLYRPGNAIDLELHQSKIVTITRRYITGYIAYRFYAKGLTISGGPSINTLISFKQNDDVQLSEYKESPGVRAGFLFKLSKIFDVNSVFFIEPEIRFANFKGINLRGIVDDGASHFSVGFSLKYRY